MDLDHALRIDPLAALTAESTVDQKGAYEQWERSNRMSLMIIKNSISVAIRGAIPDSENAKDYLSSAEEQFKGTSKAHASTLILKMLTTKYDGVGGVREHIMMMSDMANKLKGMDMEINEGFLVHFIMTSLPMQFAPFKINYNTQKKKWKMSELIAICMQEEERLKVEKPNVVHVATTNSNKRKGSWKGKGSSGDNFTPNKVQKRIQVLAHSKAGFRTIRRLERIQQTVKVGNGVDLNVEAIVTLSLILKGGFCLNLYETLYGKMTKGNKKGATRSTGLLELIHTDICGPFPSAIGGHKSFITFIDDYSRYMYLFLINEKSKSLDIFETFKAKVENQLDRKIKVVRSDRGGEYYGRHTDVGQALGSFFDFCKDHGIINQYTMPGTKEYKLTYTRSDNLEVIGYLDSDFAKCKDTSRSIEGYFFMLSGGPISWKSKKQVLTTTSTMMAEYVSVYNVKCHAMLLRNLITGLKIINSISRPLKIYCDNSAAMSFSNSHSSTGAGLYLDTKYLFVHERVEEQSISIKHIRTHKMLADPLTKGLPPKVFQGHVAKICFRQDLT
uniref:UBN2_2 domain-containing protein n=1 Tax=Tanacetum cinerariifolium TaxID=118510 RepID=A0A6L2J180_TANCI|nr:UBN2_2 domain-containing protein [Tanacetum cinerariifolium]